MKVNNSNISVVTKSDLCVGCGICVDICPSHAIIVNIKGGRFVPRTNEGLCKNSKGCHRCMNACPGIGINLLEMSVKRYSEGDVSVHQDVGRFLKCYKGYSKDSEVRQRASSGGLVSQFLIWLLENKKIDGVVLTKFDKNANLKVKSFIATCKEEVLSAMGSKYAPVSFHSVINELKKAEGTKYVVVGLPCHVHGLRKLMEIDKKLNDKIVGIFSLFCSGSQTFNYTEYILKRCGGDVDHLDYLAYRQGNPTGMVAKGTDFEFKKEYHKYNAPLKATFYPRRCLLCVDMFGELADLCFGDIQVEKPNNLNFGIGCVIARDKYWLELLSEAYSSGAISISEISIEALLYKRSMAKIKKTRNASFILMLKKIGYIVPVYDSLYEARVNLRIILKYVVMRTKQFIGRHKKLWFVLPQIK